MLEAYSSMRAFLYILTGSLMVTALSGRAASASSHFKKDIHPVVEEFCLDCHDSETKKGDLDLSKLEFNPNDEKNFGTWVKVFDRVDKGEMPPKKKDQPSTSQREKFTKTLSATLIDADEAKIKLTGRAVWRRMNRYEYENTLRDLLHAPWLQIKEMLPEDGESHRFNKVGSALDISHVQMARYLNAADYALHEVIAPQVKPIEKKTTRYYAREQPAFSHRVKFTVFNSSPERSTFPIIGFEADIPALTGKAPMTVGAKDPKKREQEAMGVVASTYEPIEIRFDRFRAPEAGHYKLRFNAMSFWAGPDKKRWWKPDRMNISKGHRDEPVSIYAETPPRLLRKLGAFDVYPDPSVQELDVYLLKGETIRPDAVRLFRSRPSNYHNPLAEKDGQPGVAFRWMEVEGPIMDQWPSEGHKLLFSDLPIKEVPGHRGEVEVVSNNPKADAERLLRRFMQRAYRQPVQETDVQRFLSVIQNAMDSGSSFMDAMIAGYSGVLCSPAFVTMEEKPGKLDDYALASRLSYFLWNSEPDDTLRALADNHELHKDKVLRQQTERLLNDPKSKRFINAFLDYWLDLRKANNTSPDATLYPDYYLDDLLTESSVDETQLFFAELVKHDLPARNIISSDFTMLNERLAAHYGLPKVDGVHLQRISLPKDSVRGGVMTQASILKVTANGTTTSPVLRGVWIMERIIGQPPPPPPPKVPAIEPDTRGANTIREQLEKHRTLATCNACHAKIDPAGFALENFDVMGGWRDKYRALGDGKPTPGYGKSGLPFTFHDAQPVDASGVLPDGRKFKDIRELKALLLSDERAIAENMVHQLLVYSTGAPVRFGDREAIDDILKRSKSSHYGIRTLIDEIIQSDLFREK